MAYLLKDKKGFAFTGITLGVAIVFAILILVLFGMPIITIGIFISQNIALIAILVAIIVIFKLFSGKK